MMTPQLTPEEIKAIEEEANDMYGPLHRRNNLEREAYIKAATAYSLKAKELAYDQDKEIERLKGLIKEGFIALNKKWNKSLGQIDRDWDKFKTENNL